MSFEVAFFITHNINVYVIELNNVDMKAFSIKQPWAWLIVNGHKDIENRNWKTNYTGPIYIHASKSFDSEGYVWVLSNRALLGMEGVEMPEPHKFERGGVVGAANITECVIYSKSPWFFGKHGLVMKNAKTLPFFPCKGALKFFNVQIK